MKEILHEALIMWAEENDLEMDIKDFEIAGVLTNNEGLVVEIEAVGKFQLTVVQEH